MRPLATVDVATGEAAAAVAERSDVTAVPAMGVIAEAMAAFVLAAGMLEKFGGDSLGEARRNSMAMLRTLPSGSAPASDKPHLVLVGLPGVVKVVGRRGARRRKLARPFLDFDTEIEAREGMTVERILRGEGRGAFPRLRARALARSRVDGRRWCSPPAAAGSRARRRWRSSARARA